MVNNYHRPWTWVSSLIGAVFVLAACTSVSPVVKIGLVGPFEGKGREIGYDVIYGARLAVREVNKNEDLGDYRLSLVALDDFGDPLSAQEVAKSMVVDEGVMVVIGHWLPKTTKSGQSIYSEYGLPIIMTGEEPFGAIDPKDLPEEFLQAYAEITPFDEDAGPFAAAGYDAVYLAVAALNEVLAKNVDISRGNIGEALGGLSYKGVSGVVFAPEG